MQGSEIESKQQQLIQQVVHIKAIEKKGSARFMFVKSNPTQEECQRTRDQIKFQLRDKLKLIIEKPPITNLIDEQGVVPSDVPQLDKELCQLAKKLDVEITIADQDYIFSSPKQYFQEYETTEYLGEGCLGLVKKTTHRQSGLSYAVKIVATIDDEIIRNMIIEFKNLIRLDHQNIVKMHQLYIDHQDGFQQESRAYVLMELIQGKELFEMINELGHYCEEDAKQLFQQLLSAIEYMHKHGICHRDLKPHNILCVENQLQLKITDFNVSKFSENYKEFSELNQMIEMWTYTGTVAFSAPEIFSGEGYTLNELIELIRDAKYEFQASHFEQVSAPGKDLIVQLLQKDPLLRPTASQAIQHVWFQEKKVFTRKTLRNLTLKENLTHLTGRRSHRNRQKFMNQVESQKNIIRSDNDSNSITSPSQTNILFQSEHEISGIRRKSISHQIKPNFNEEFKCSSSNKQKSIFAIQATVQKFKQQADEETDNEK